MLATSQCIEAATLVVAWFGRDECVGVRTTAESELVSHPLFGNSAAIRRRAGLYYSRGIEIVAKYETSAARTLDALSRASDDRSEGLAGPVIRRAINNVLSGIKEGCPDVGDDDRAAFLAAAGDQLGEVGPATLISSRPILSRNGHGAGLDVWDPKGAPGAMDSYFQALFDQEIAGKVSSRRVVLREPTPEILVQLKRGEAILAKLVPNLWSSVVDHVRLVAVLDTSDRSQWSKPTRSDVCQNVSTHAIPSTIFLSPSPLRTAWHTAEALLHEAAHKKLSDLVLTRSVFKEGFDSEKANWIRATWNRHLSWNSANWSTDRALFAFHVYIHLALFFEMAEATNVKHHGFGAPPVSFRGERVKALDRATYLGAKLRSDSGDLGPDGRKLVTWLSDVLRLFGHEEDVVVIRRLLLDCYDRETLEIEEQLNALGQVRGDGATRQEVASGWPGTDVDRVVDHLVHSEVVGAFRALSILGEAEGPSFAHYDGDRWMRKARSKATLAERTAVLCGLRRFMSSTLRAAPQEAFLKMYQTRRRKTLLDHLEEMVNHFGRHSQRLQSALASYR